MKHTSTAALLAAAALAGGVFSSVPGSSSPLPQVSETSSTKQTPADRGQNLPSDTKSDRLGTGYYRRHRAPVGKRYRASVKQHQRHAAKARNKAKMR